jgi:hypothetical protein
MGCIVPTNDPNNGGRPASAEDWEGRRPTKENASPWSRPGLSAGHGRVPPRVTRTEARSSCVPVIHLP